MATASWKELDKDALRVMLKPLNLKRRLNASQPRREASLRLYSAGSAAFLLTSGALMISGIAGWTAILLGGGLFSAAYVIAVPASGALKKRDIEDLVAISDVSGPLRLPLRTVLSIMAKLARHPAPDRNDDNIKNL